MRGLNFILTGDCDFESGLCIWHNTNTGDQFDWTFGKGGTSTTGTGPKADHTTGTTRGNFFINEL